MKGLSQHMSDVSLTLLLLLFLLLQISTTTAADKDTDYIKTSCNSTLYKSLCFVSLSPFASTIQSNPQKLASTALNLSLSASESASAFVKSLPLRRKSVSPREAAAVSDCVEVMGDSVSHLRDSIGEMKNVESSSSFDQVMSDVQTWVSAALTDDDTCIDGFNSDGGGGGGKAVLKNMIRRCIVRVAQMTSNALALVNMYASTRRN